MRYSHTALSVKNLSKSQKFYENVFNLKFKIQAERPELGVKFIMLEDSSGAVIELFEHDNPTVLKEDLMNFQQVGFKHIAFVVENIEEVMNKALKEGAKIIWPIKKGITVKRIAFVSDPNGLPIELVEL